MSGDSSTAPVAISSKRSEHRARAARSAASARDDNCRGRGGDAASGSPRRLPVPRAADARRCRRRCRRPRPTGSSPRNACSSRSASHQPWLNRKSMIATAIATVGITSSTPKSSILPSGTPSRPARARAPTPGTVSTMPHSRPMAIAVAIRGGAVLADLLGQVAPERRGDHQQHVEEDRLQQRRDGQRQRVRHPLGAEDPQQRARPGAGSRPSLAASRPSARRRRSADRPRP